jgi:hypothetical protein
VIASVERYPLALAVLEGEHGAHRILADLLEEQGDRGLAQWARAKKSRKIQRLSFVLALLPCREAIGIAAHLIWRCVEQQVEQSRKSILSGVQVIADWSRGTRTDAELLIACGELDQIHVRLQSAYSPRYYRERYSPLARDANNLGTACQMLSAAAKAGERAVGSSALAGAGSPRHWSEEAARRVRAIVAMFANGNPSEAERVTEEAKSVLNHLTMAGA